MEPSLSFMFALPDPPEWLLPLLALLLLCALVAVVRYAEAVNERFLNKPLEPADLASRLNAVADADLRARLQTILEKTTKVQPLTAWSFDQAIVEAKQAQAAARQAAVLGAASLSSNAL
jgi:hypothetical protein